MGSEYATVMFHYVYVLESKKTSHPYVGRTPYLRKRIQEHNKGESYYTSKYTPWRLIHFEAYIEPKDAERREKYLKTAQGKRTLRRMLKEYYKRNQKRR